VLWTLALALMTMPCPAAPEGALAGVVRDPGGGPLAGARVEVRCRGTRWAAYTDGAGRFAIGGVAAGSHDVRVLAPGLPPLLRRAVEVRAHTTATLVLDAPVPVLRLARLRVRVKAPLVNTIGSVRQVYDADLCDLGMHAASRDRIYLQVIGSVAGQVPRWPRFHGRPLSPEEANRQAQEILRGEGTLRR
jgi:hypothetical protein